MLERIQDRSILHELISGGETLLHGARRAMAQWAVVDDYDQILDLDCGDGKLLDYMSKRYSLRACGITNTPAHARSLRDKLPDCEVFLLARKIFRGATMRLTLFSIK